MQTKRPTLIHFPLEPYKSRYTEFLESWEEQAFSKDFVYYAVHGAPSQHNEIQTGEVLDSTRRGSWCAQQVENFLSLDTSITGDAELYFSDFFTPGLEAIQYSRFAKNRKYAFCWAQTWDVYDFTRKMLPWMREWEKMALNIYDVVFVASPLLKEFIEASEPNCKAKIIVVGLPFNSAQVSKQVDPRKIEQGRPFDCVYSSRLDAEKNPYMFMALVEKCPKYDFALCTPYADIRSNDPFIAKHIKEQIDKLDNLTVFYNCDKATYYSVLASSKTQFNCAYQDWVSFTLLEALTFGCTPLYPCVRSFPDVFNYTQDFLYPPGNVTMAAHRLSNLREHNPNPFLCEQILEQHNQTLSKICNVIRNA